jgi:hypothetical protein
MVMTHRQPFLKLAWLLLMMTNASLSACGTDPQTGSPGSLCPTCEARTGGETSDFPQGSEGPCATVTRRVVLSESEAEALPFVELADLRARVERPIDVPLHWMQGDAEKTRATGGYAAETRLHVETQVVSYRYMEPDPALCDGTTCVPEEGEPVEQSTCPLLLLLETKSELHTDDGALTAALAGEVGKWAPGYEHVIGPNAADELIGHSYADLGDVRGTLALETEGPEPHRGTLTLQVNYLEEDTEGYLWPTLIFEAESRIFYDMPIRGAWPTDRGAEASEAGVAR